jgi:hypothetical protein
METIQKEEKEEIINKINTLDIELKKDGRKQPRSQKQIEAFEVAKNKRYAILRERKEEMNKLLEEKILEKALSIKKRQIKAMAIFDGIPDDNTPIEEIKNIVRSTTPIKRINTIQSNKEIKNNFLFI